MHVHAVVSKSVFLVSLCVRVSVCVCSLTGEQPPNIMRVTHLLLSHHVSCGTNTTAMTQAVAAPPACVCASAHVDARASACYARVRVIVPVIFSPRVRLIVATVSSSSFLQ